MEGYVSGTHDRDGVNFNAYPDAADEGSASGGMMPCQLEGNKRLWYMVQKDQIVTPTGLNGDETTPFALNCEATNNFGYPLCSCDTGGMLLLYSVLVHFLSGFSITNLNIELILHSA